MSEIGSRIAVLVSAISTTRRISRMSTRRIQDTTWRGWLLILIVALNSLGCGVNPPDGLTSSNQKPLTTEQLMELTSTGFEQGAAIDAKYTADGQDLSPPLAWSGAPENTQSFTLICDDPDAPSPKRPADQPWVHWVIFNLGRERSAMPEGMERVEVPSQFPEAAQGKNSWPSDNLGYRGPAPPPGSGRHRYFFKIYALDTTLDLEPGATKKQVLEAISGHVLAEGQLMGTYVRS
jgi:Raf kinase inhibitor-like YbhB/YbcL family protein